MLRRSVTSLRSLAHYPEHVIVHVAADFDDPATAFEAGALETDCLVTSRRYGYDELHIYYQQLAARSKGEWLLVWNDDAIMLTQDWDVVLDELPGSVLVADLQSHHSPMCCFPAARKRAVDIIGRFCSDNPHVDSFWQDVGRGTGTIAVVPIHVHHAQVAGRPGWGDQHDYYGPAHQADLTQCAATLREALAL
jgi:hypothetical protein